MRRHRCGPFCAIPGPVCVPDHRAFAVLWSDASASILPDRESPISRTTFVVAQYYRMTHFIIPHENRLPREQTRTAKEKDFTRQGGGSFSWHLSRWEHLNCRLFSRTDLFLDGVQLFQERDGTEVEGERADQRGCSFSFLFCPLYELRQAG